MFPAYRGGRGGGGGGGGRGRHHQQHHQSNRGHYQGQGQNWDTSDGPSGGFMIDRGGPGPSASYNAPYGSGGGRGGGDRRGGGGGGGSHNQWGHNSGQGRRGGGGDRPEVVDIDGSDDDNVVYDAARNDNNDNGRKRHRSGSSSRSHKRKKRDRSRSPESRHGHREDRHHHSAERNRNHGHGERGDRGRDGHGPRRPDNRGWGNANPHQQGLGHSEWNPNVPVAPPPLMAMPTPTPWMLDNNPNPFDHFQMQQQRTGGRGDFNNHDHRGRGGNYGMDHDSRDRGRRDGRGQGNERERERSGRASRWDDGFQAQEQRRLQISSGYPKKVFLEEVNLNSEFAFRLDTSSNPGLINYRSIAMSQKSTYEGGVGKGILGATEDEISKVYSKFHAFRCKPPASMNEGEEDSQKSEDDEDEKETQKADSSAKDYISIGKDDESANRGLNDRFDTGRDFDSYSFERKDGEMNVQEKTEYYNKEVRNQPNNISLWTEFVKFQDKVFEESNMIFGQNDGQGQKSKKKKSNRKALLEKKIAILEKALESNPNCLLLHLQRLECLLDLYKPRHVLTEWKKLVLQHQQSAPFWMEYLMFSASQLLIYSNSSTVTIFDTCFQKFRLMMNPQYPEFQRPRKFLLFTSDVTFGLGLLLKNAGYLERAIALHQAQLEFDFHCPKDVLNGDTVQNWKKISEAFDTFWETGTPRFGEAGCQGWEFYVDNTPKDRQSVTLSDSAISQFEEDTFEAINERLKSEADADETEEDGGKLRSIKYEQKPTIWTSMESCRSKLYWLPWRELCSDIDDCEDAQRVVPSSSILNFLCPLPNEANFISQFDKSAAHFRHIINFLMTLREDFIPHTQSIDFVCSPFFSTTLTESSSLFTEIYYWKKLIDIYVEANTPENASKFHHVFAPERFKLQDLVSPNVTTAEILKPTIFDVSLKAQSLLENEIAPPGEDEPDVFDKKLTLLRENNSKYMEMFYRVLGIGLEKLDPEFSCILFEMLLRFEQKLTCTEPGNIKQRIKFAKGLMKNEKLRNAIGGYRELAMLEYFGGSSERAVELLLKTIDPTRKSLESDEWDQINWEQDWKLIVDLVSLYRQLVELYLRNGTSENDSKAYYTLIQLGNCFKPIDPNFLGKMNEKEKDGEEQQWTPKTNLLLKASRSFEKIMTMLIPNFKSESDELLEKDVYCKWGGENCVEFLLQQRNLIVECTCCYALFQFLSKGFDEACLVYESVLKRLNSEQFKTRENYNPELIRFHIREQLYINWCNLASRCLMKDPLMNSKFRSILSKALEEFPSSPPLLILFTDVENQTSVAGKLWRLMMNNMKPDSEKMVTQWAPLIMGIGLARKIEELEHDEEVGLPVFGLGGPAVPQDTIFYKLDSMISVAEQHPGIRNCPLLWRVHLKMLALRSREGKDVERAKKTFYDAVRHCPSSKSIYLDGVAYFPELLQEVNELMAEKQLLVRLPLEELDVLLELDEENGSIASKGEGEVEEEEENEEENNDKGRISVDQRKVRESKSEGEIGDSD